MAQISLIKELGFDGLSVIYRIARVIGEGGDLKRVMADILQILETHAGMNRGMITILKPDNSELAVDVTHGLNKSEKQRGKYRLGEGITGKVVETGKAVMIPRLSDEPKFLDRTGVRQKLKKDDLSFLCVPIKVRNIVIGALSVDKVSMPGNITSEKNLRFLEAVADLIAQVVQERRRQRLSIQSLKEENLKLRRAIEELEGKGITEWIIGNSGSMRTVYRKIAQVAKSATTVLILGDTGTGKELVARAIHEKSKFKDGLFVPVNCAALPESLLESELFGHEKGSFTGAIDKQIGSFEEANNGTLFLDEIGEMSLKAQSRLLRAIQEKSIQRIGSRKSIDVNVRIICATNRDLEEDVALKKFRKDLYYRINVFTITLPPLKKRKADIILLADHFVQKYAAIHGKDIVRISTPAIDMLTAYHWPGNVRELENVIEHAIIVAVGNVINAHDFPPSLQMKDPKKQGKRSDNFKTLVEIYEKELITDALKDAHGNQTEAARLLGTTKRVVQYKVDRYGIEYLRFRKALK